MKKEVFEIDENGHILERHVSDFDEQGNPVNELSPNIVAISPPDGLYCAKWTGTEWIEDMSQEEIDALNNQPHEPTETEMLRDYVLDLDYRLILMELGI
jgi:hypothetical protein